MQDNNHSTPSVFNFTETAVLRVITDEQGEYWFAATDVCVALEFGGRSRDYLRMLDDDEKGAHIMRTPGGDQEVQIINESGLYSLILKSRKPEAKRFKKWVTSEVLPTIRKTGRYETPTEPSINPAQQRQLQNAIAARFPDGKHRPYAWSRFNNHFKLGSYKQLSASRIEEALLYVATMPGGAAPQGQRWLLQFDEAGKPIMSPLSEDTALIPVAELKAAQNQVFRALASALEPLGHICEIVDGHAVN